MTSVALERNGRPPPPLLPAGNPSRCDNGDGDRAGHGPPSSHDHLDGQNDVSAIEGPRHSGGSSVAIDDTPANAGLVRRGQSIAPRPPSSTSEIKTDILDVSEHVHGLYPERRYN